MSPGTAVRKGGFRGSLKAFLTYTPSGRVKPQVTILFCRQLASFVRVGVAVTTAIETFAEQATNPRLRQVYRAVVADLKKGMRLSDAFAAHPQVFPRIVSDMVRSAEATGNLDVVLRQAAKHVEREAGARQRIKAAMMYPAVIMGFAVVITIGIVVFVLPKFRDLYASLGVATPGILNAMLNLSAYVRDHDLPIVAGLLAVILLTGLGARTERGRYLFDSVVLRLPVIAALVRTSMTERFCRTLGDMLGAGVPISQTYAVVISNVRNVVYRRALERVGPAMAAGQGMYRPLQHSGIFAPAVIQMFRVGEETGRLDINLVEAADMYEEELDYRIKRLTAFLEPAMIIFVGLVVGFIAVTLITSIYSLAGSYK
ncbi:MAG: type II secretion system F family protein [Candidatus Dormibacteria bacterium]